MIVAVANNREGSCGLLNQVIVTDHRKLGLVTVVGMLFVVTSSLPRLEDVTQRASEEGREINQFGNGT